MNKAEIVKLFLEKGATIDPEALEYFYNNPEKIETVLQKISQFGQTISYSDILSVLKQYPKIGQLKLLKEKGTEGISIFDVSKLLISRYEKLKEYLAGRMELVNTVSINKITDRSSKFSLIVMVKRKDDKNRAVEVEDLTGNTIIYFSDNDKRFDLIVNDEVLGVFCEMKNDRIEVLNVIWPDIPLKREIASTKEDTYCIFLSNLSDNQEKYDKLLQALVEFSNKNSYIFFIGSFIFSDQFKNFLDSIPADISKIFVSNERLSYEGALHFSEPALIKVEDSIVLLLCDGSRFYKYKEMWPIASTEILLNVLKKRQLSPEFDIMQSRNEDIQLIDIVPDVFVSGNIGEPNLTNYKGTTIVANGSFDSQPIYYVINLKTRESIKINLS